MMRYCSNIDRLRKSQYIPDITLQTIINSVKKGCEESGLLSKPQKALAFLMMSKLGLRPGELVQIRLSDIENEVSNKGYGCLHIRKNKGVKVSGDILLSQDLLSEIMTFAAIEGLKEDDYLFRSRNRRGMPITTMALTKTLNSICESLRIVKRYTLSDFRNTFLINLVKDGASLQEFTKKGRFVSENSAKFMYVISNDFLDNCAEKRENKKCKNENGFLPSCLYCPYLIEERQGKDATDDFKCMYDTLWDKGLMDDFEEFLKSKEQKDGKNEDKHC